jgi:hypothetical protein
MNDEYTESLNALKMRNEFFTRFILPNIPNDSVWGWSGLIDGIWDDFNILSELKSYSVESNFSYNVIQPDIYLKVNSNFKKFINNYLNQNYHLWGYIDNHIIYNPKSNYGYFVSFEHLSIIDICNSIYINENDIEDYSNYFVDISVSENVFD